MDSAMRLFMQEAHGLSNMPAEVAPVPELAHPPDELVPRKDRDPRYASGIAIECGLADQAHLNKSFRRFVGECPGAWRRARVAPLQ
jgi:AraC-like DNA-binding protein